MLFALSMIRSVWKERGMFVSVKGIPASGGAAYRQKPLGLRWKHSLRKHWQLYLVLAIPVSWLIIFAYIPMYGITMAFQNFTLKKGYFGSDWVGFDNFFRFFRSNMFPTLLRNTIGISLYSFIAGSACPILLALMLNEVGHAKYKKTVQMISYLPYFISAVLIVSMLRQLFSDRGLVNNLYQAVGLAKAPFFGNPYFYKHLYVWSGVWSGVGYGTVIYIAALAKVDIQLYEAAIIDGASKLQKIWHIDLPSILPTVTILLILGISGIMNVGFQKVYLMQNNINIGVSEVISTYVYKVGLVNREYSFAAAVSIFNSVVNVILLVIANTIARKVSETSLW